MTRYARVESLDSLQAFKVALVKFAEASVVALADADSEISRTMSWLENEQTAYWQGQIRKRQQMVERCRDALRQKKLYPDSLGRPQSTFDEEKALRLAVARYEQAELKLANTRKYVRVMQREQQNYKGGVQRFSTCATAEIPEAIAKLSGMLGTLKEYVATGPVEAGSEASAESGAASMARGDTEEVKKVEETPEEGEG